MSTTASNHTRMARIGDWANAILVKETRQALKSRQFVGTFMLLLAAAWLIAVLGILDQGVALQYGSAGRDFFFYFYIAVAISTMIIVPFSAFRSLQGERDFNTFELLSITTLTPRQIVWGKLSSALVQLLIFYSAVMPFIAFSSLLQGFDVARFMFILAATMVVSLLLSMAALMMSTLARQRVTQGVVSIATLMGLGSVCSSSIQLVNEWLYGWSDLAITDPRFWEVIGVMAVIGVSYFILFQQVTIAQLTFESDNHSTGVRVVAMAQFLLLWFGFFAITAYKSLDIWMEGLVVLSVMSGLHWLVFGGVIATEEDALSHRVRRGLPRRRILRLLFAPWLPGGARGYLNLVLQLVLLWWLVAGAVAFNGYSRSLLSLIRGGSSRTTAQFGGAGISEFVSDLLAGGEQGWNPAVMVTTAICCQLLFYVGIAAALGRWGMAISHEIKPPHARIVGLFVGFGGILWPFLPRLLEIVPDYRFSLVDVTCPFRTFAELVQRTTPRWDLLMLLWIGAGIGILLNLKAMWRSVAVLSAPSERDAPVRQAATHVALERS